MSDGDALNKCSRVPTGPSIKKLGARLLKQQLGWGGVGVTSRCLPWSLAGNQSALTHASGVECGHSNMAMDGDDSLQYRKRNPQYLDTCPPLFGLACRPCQC